MTKPTLKPLNQQAIVITGATSGIGLATARRAAKAGACVFLIARGEKDLRALCEELQGTGARAAWAVADVADYDALAEAADKCRRLFGGFDTWVNNAGVSIYGSVLRDDAGGPAPAVRDQLLGRGQRLDWSPRSICAAVRAAGPSSTSARSCRTRPMPIQGVYSASKACGEGLHQRPAHGADAGQAIRRRADQPVLVKPAAVDTPYSKHARNLTGYAVPEPAAGLCDPCRRRRHPVLRHPSDPRDHRRRRRAADRQLSTRPCPVSRNHFSPGSLLS
jgi:NAD(P)-dependent dehydrogenase (short-subunit alcohol dehydrogenase family)